MKNKKNIIYLVVALALAAVTTYITYPGIYYSDSYTRWYFTENIISGNPENLTNYLSVAPQYLMAPLFLLSGEYGLVTFVQSFGFFYTSLLVLDRLCGRFKPVVMALFVCCPVFYGFSVYFEMSVGVVIAINCFILLLFKTKQILQSGILWRKILLMLGYGAVYFVLFGFRQNALTLFPMIFISLWIITRGLGTKARFALLAKQAVIMAVIVLFIGKIPVIAGYGEIYNNASKGYLWDAVKTLEKVWDDENYHDWYDFLGEGATATMVEKNKRNTMFGAFDNVNFDVTDESQVYAVNRRYIKLIVSEPVAFIGAKWETVMELMGVTAPLAEKEFEYDWGGYGLMEDYNVRHSKAREVFVQSYKDFQALIPLFRMPYVIFIAVLAVMALCFKRLSKETLTAAILLFFTACFYYGAFFVNAQSIEFRYFFPALYLLFVTAATVLTNINLKS